MATKREAAAKTTTAGIPLVIASGGEPAVLQKLLRGEALGTLFLAREDRLGARKRWIAFAAPPQGRLVVDAGAVRALTGQGRSLLPSGVTSIEGAFGAGDVVAVVDGDSHEFARGLVNFDADELRRIRGA